MKLNRSLHAAAIFVVFLIDATSAQVPKEDNTVTSEETLLASLQEARDFLKVNSSSGDFLAKIEDLISQSESLETAYAALKATQQNIDKLVRQANAKQLEVLVGRMNETLEKETKLRTSVLEYTQSLEGKETKEIDTEELVSIGEVKKTFDASTIMKQSEQQIQNWILEIMKDEVEVYKEKLLSETKAASKCPSVTDVVQDVHVALTKFSKDGTGLVDHAQGAEIVHTLTSATYTPPPEASDLLGNTWWRKYIPEDWEQLLPSGWEQWNTAIPSYIHHTLSIKGAKVAPPETILEKKTVAGACWPMHGSRGQITMRLPYPMFIESVTIDHIFWELVPEEMWKSAPKEMRVIGYPACAKNDHCYALGFDDTDPMEIARIEYDLQGTTFQTFDTIFTQGSDAVEEDSESGDEAGSCSAEKTTSCNSPPRMSFGGVTLEILDNYGNSEYTCLYRFRVHGQPDIF